MMETLNPIIIEVVGIKLIDLKYPLFDLNLIDNLRSAEASIIIGCSMNYLIAFYPQVI